MTKKMFAPGCALLLYKPQLAEKLHSVLNENIGETDILSTCCRHEPKLTTKTQVINVCPGCDKRYRNDYSTTSTVSLWEIIAQHDFFPLPNYHGKVMTILDACPTRDQTRIHQAIRSLLKKMNITVVEPEKTQTNSVCCGDSFYSVIPTGQMKEQMKKRALEMPVEDVVVYCVSCVKAVYIGGKKPRYMIDLLFGEETLPKTYEPDQWHKELDEYIDNH